MRLLILPLMLTALPAAAAPVEAPSSPITDRLARAAGDTCKRPDVHQAETLARVEARKLAELPPGDLILSVFHEVDGCMEPVIVRYGDGSAPQAAPAPVPEPVRPQARVWR
jgi:hypothetical protein